MRPLIYDGQSFYRLDLIDGKKVPIDHVDLPESFDALTHVSFNYFRGGITFLRDVSRDELIEACREEYDDTKREFVKNLINIEHPTKSAPEDIHLIKQFSTIFTLLNIDLTPIKSLGVL